MEGLKLTRKFAWVFPVTIPKHGSLRGPSEQLSLPWSLLCHPKLKGPLDLLIILLKKGRFSPESKLQLLLPEFSKYLYFSTYLFRISIYWLNDFRVQNIFHWLLIPRKKISQHLRYQTEKFLVNSLGNYTLLSFVLSFPLIC